EDAGNTQSFLYCKGSEQIIDFLTFIGATKHSLKLINVTMHKELRNNINRVTNCESANIDKAVRASLTQIRDIKLVFAAERERGQPLLCDKLREIAIIRLKNPEMPLGEISELLKTPLSKSGVNHRLKKISEIASEITTKQL
ncbi:MAG: DNA-binding protein WhiA, partial [Oscillospiraceae bacterium]|nr:DNA-binding protein WhiA [Oscillospiraceae bacterium]